MNASFEKALALASELVSELARLREHTTEVTARLESAERDVQFLLSLEGRLERGIGKAGNASVISLGGERLEAANLTLRELGLQARRVKPPDTASPEVQREVRQYRRRDAEPAPHRAVSLMLTHAALWECTSDWQLIFEDDVARADGLVFLERPAINEILAQVAMRAPAVPIVYFGLRYDLGHVRVMNAKRGGASWKHRVRSQRHRAIDLTSCVGFGLHAYAVRCRNSRGLFERARRAIPHRLRYPSHARFNADVLLRYYFEQAVRNASEWPLCARPFAFKQDHRRFPSMLNHSRESFR